MCFHAFLRAFDSITAQVRQCLAILLCLPIASVSSTEVLFVSNYVANSGNLTLFDYDGTSLSSRQVITSNVNGPTGLAFVGSGNLFVANVGTTSAPFTSKVAKYVPDSGGDFAYDSQFSSTANMIGPRGLAIGAAGHFYAANTNQNTMSIFDSAGVFQSNVTSVSTGPRGLAFDSAGLLYMANFNNQIRIFDVTNPLAPSQVGTITNTGGIAFNGPQGIVFDSSGRMLVSNFTDSTVSILEKSGSTWIDAGKLTGNMNGSFGMDFDSSGNLFVANFSGNSISKFTPSGGSYTFVTSFSSEITAPTFINFHTVPEPAFLIHSTVIAALIWTRLRKRRRKTENVTNG